MVLISAGFFKMGLNNSLDDESPEHRVFLDSFYIDKYEVSTKDFAEFLNIKNNVKGYYLDNKFGTLIYTGKFEPRPGLDKFPINNVTWRAANEYCKWKDKRLPSEAEWEKAARGENGNAYPWGNQAPSKNWLAMIKLGPMIKNTKFSFRLIPLVQVKALMASIIWPEMLKNG